MKSGWIKRRESRWFSSVTEFDGKLMLADLLAGVNKRGEAKKVYDRLDTEQPGRPDVAKSMGYLAMQNNDAWRHSQVFRQGFRRRGNRSADVPASG